MPKGIYDRAMAANKPTKKRAPAKKKNGRKRKAHKMVVRTSIPMGAWRALVQGNTTLADAGPMTGTGIGWHEAMTLNIAELPLEKALLVISLLRDQVREARKERLLVTERASILRNLLDSQIEYGAQRLAERAGF